ncbi:MAG: prepilin-type N-terminal cleavage/methylation domain-containing protein, partial [Proteobacteria bacterium]|nr:prepilin-type N-terminal cleavage/methylation domain-containing protein [Pseudomonadota bacterium]
MSTSPRRGHSDRLRLPDPEDSFNGSKLIGELTDGISEPFDTIPRAPSPLRIMHRATRETPSRLFGWKDPLAGLCQRPTQRGIRHASRGFTLLELVIVIIIFAVVATLIGVRTGSFSFFSQEGVLRRISETISFLHYQSLADQRMYQLEIDLGRNTFKVGQLTDIGPPDPQTAQNLQDAGVLSLELAFMLNPSMRSDQIFSAPESFPSLAEPVQLPVDMEFIDV